MAALFGLSSLPGLPLDTPAWPHLDKMVHALAYAGLGFLLVRVFHTSPLPGIARNAVVLAILTGTLYGISDEWHQSFVPGREPSALDAVFDALGCAAASLLYRPPSRRAASCNPSMSEEKGRNRP
jgi:VanZ family protein